MKHPLEVGIDLVRLTEIEASLRLFGERFVGRVFTTGETEDCGRHPHLRVARLATRLAAKEATFKVLRPTPRDPLPWSAVEVRLTRGGAPELVLHGNAARLARRRKLTSLALSLSHEGDYATAVVVGLRSSTRGSPS